MQRGSKHSPETKRKMAARRKAFWTPEKRLAASLRNSARLLKLWKTPEFREKQRQVKARAAARRRGEPGAGKSAPQAAETGQ